MNISLPSGPLRIVRLGVHLLMAVLLALTAARAASTPAAHSSGVLAATAAMAVIYVVGAVALARAPRLARPGAVPQAWLAALAAAWLALLWLTPDAVWLAFPLFLLLLHFLPVRAALPAVGLTTAAAIAGFARHQHALTPAAILGPVIGATVAAAAVLGYQALYRESEQRRGLIEQLTAARGELATAERAAGVLAERERLAQEIHDTLAQGLASIQLLLHAAERALPGQPQTAAQHVRHARATAQDNLAEARRFVRALIPPGLDDGSLPAALDRLCQAVAERSGLAVEFQVSGDPAAVPTQREVALLRIAQSALANTVAHAQARNAAVTLTYQQDDVTMEVVDDGKGFDPGLQQNGSHPAGAGRPGAGDGGFGLAAMRARTQALGGRLSVESVPGSGSAISVTFPAGDRPGPP